MMNLFPQLPAFLPPRAGTRRSSATADTGWLPAANDDMHPRGDSGRFWCYLSPAVSPAADR
jgi:hypothetical protein